MITECRPTLHAALTVRSHRPAVSHVPGPLFHALKRCRLDVRIEARTERTDSQYGLPGGRSEGSETLAVGDRRSESQRYRSVASSQSRDGVIAGYVLKLGPESA